MSLAFVNFTPLTVTALICAVAAVVLAYRKIYFALIASNFALILAFIDGDTPLGTFIFWIVATAVAGLLVYILPDEVKENHLGVSFMVTGALAGMSVGVAIGTISSLIISSVVGVFFGALVLSNAVPDHEFKFPSKKHFNYVMAKGLPIVVVMCVVGIVLADCIAIMKTY